jgi:hypothetical protein
MELIRGGHQSVFKRCNLSDGRFGVMERKGLTME